MSEEHTADQVKAEHLSQLGLRLGPVFSELQSDVAWLQVKWTEYRELYGTSPERVGLLNEAAGLFFKILQNTLWEDALLHLCRLTDPSVMRGRQNLSIQALPELCEDPNLRGEVAELVSRALTACSFARDWRNRHIGHRDRTLALQPTSKPLTPGSRADVSAAIASVHEVLNHISERLLGSKLADTVIVPPTGALALLYLLRDGREAQAAKKERIRSGRYSAEDLQDRPI